MPDFDVISDFEPRGDQPKAIDQLRDGLLEGRSRQVLLGVTGSGKTFTLAHTIAAVNRPTLILAPNKTLAAQLFGEFKELFPHNAVEYFVSYYDYYQPEAYIPASDTYIQKDASINDMIDKLRHSATRSVLSRRDVIVVASVSCIFGLGAPEEYLEMRLELVADEMLERDRMLAKLVEMQYDRNDTDFHRGVFRVRGDRVEIYPAYEEDLAIRVDFFGDEIEQLSEIDPLRGEVRRRLSRVSIFPASHYVTKRSILNRAIQTIKTELKERTAYFNDQNQLIECQRIEERTNFDLEMIHEMGYCNGIENYSRHLTGRSPGDPPPTLLDYFPSDFLTIIDESHIAVPQLRAMYRGDRSRKETLVRFGFRLPSALDNRPLRFDEFETRVGQVIYASATPSDYELTQSQGCIAEQIVRPTGLVDPVVEVRTATHQVDDLLTEIQKRVGRDERVLVTTLTKRMAEDLTDYYDSVGVRTRYLHSEVKTFERMDIIRDLRSGNFDVLIGINLLREGLDLPEVSLVAILDADKEGFLRSTRSLIQTFGRAARNANGKVILYADRNTDAMQVAISETQRRREIQMAFNIAHQITPATIEKKVVSIFDFMEKDAQAQQRQVVAETVSAYQASDDPRSLIRELEAAMHAAAGDLEFERAAELRDRIAALKKIQLID